MNNVTESNYNYIGGIEHEKRFDTFGTTTQQHGKDSIAQNPPSQEDNRQIDAHYHYQNPLLAGTIRSTHTTSTAQIVDQLQKIKVEWDILERAQLNVIQEKEQIANELRIMQRQQDKMERKQWIQDHRVKLDQERERIGLEM